MLLKKVVLALVFVIMSIDTEVDASECAYSRKEEGECGVNMSCLNKDIIYLPDECSSSSDCKTGETCAMVWAGYYKTPNWTPSGN